MCSIPNILSNSQSNEMDLELDPSNTDLILNDQLSSEKTPATFQVNRDMISCIAVENQPDELKTLGLIVYDQSKFEEGILKQVDDALQEQELNKVVKSDAKHKCNSKKKAPAVETLPERHETEKEKLVRLGHMTPFGSVLKSEEQPPSGLSSFERYLLEQEHLNSKRSTLKVKSNNKKGKSLKSLVQIQPAQSFTTVLDKKQTSKPSVEKQCHSEFKKYSDSEYLPSDEDIRGSTSAKQSRKRKSDEWASDDSDWEYSDPEGETVCSSKRRSSRQLIDDGRTSDYKERLALWMESGGKSKCDYEMVSKM